MDRLDLNSALLLDASYVHSAIAQQKADVDMSSLLFPLNRAAMERELYQNSVAIIRVAGSIWNSGWRSYSWIMSEFEAALNNDHVKGIAFVFDTPGGVVNGCFDSADYIFKNRDKKPTIAIINEQASSAGYALASACQKIFVPRTAVVGSVGVIALHSDCSGALERWGEKITIIHEGAHKKDGNPYEPLPEEVRNRMQSQIHSTYELFTQTVARNRGMTVAAVTETEALVYAGADAVQVGFADEVLSAREALELFANEVKPSSTGEVTMKMKAEDFAAKLKAEGVSDETITKLELPSSGEIDLEEPTSAAPEQNASAGEEKERVKSIMSSDLAKGKEEMAQHLALDTEMSLEQAEATLAKTPLSDPLSTAMNNGSHPDVDAEGGEEGSSDAQKISSSWADAHKRTGATLKS